MTKIENRLISIVVGAASAYGIYMQIFAFQEFWS